LVNVQADAPQTVSVSVTCVPVTQRILFGSNRNGNYDLYVMDADGGNVIRLTFDTAYHGSWSPDGSQITYMSPGTGIEQIYVMRADGSHIQQLTSGAYPSDFPQWSPDGSKIVYNMAGHFWVMKADGSNETPIGPFAVNNGASWSPDGNRLLYSATDATETEQLFVMNTDGTGVTQLTYGQGFFHTLPTWSPDGTRIAFVTDSGCACTNTAVMNADVTNTVQLTNGPSGRINEDVAWSPDGTRLAFRTSRDDGHPEIYVMNADGSQQTNISQNVWDNYGPAWHP
jgi:Tol biopolymer transport system component